MLEKSLRGGIVVVGGFSIGGSLEPTYNTVAVAELVFRKGRANRPAPRSTRRQLFDLSHEMAAKLNVVFYTDSREALLKSIGDM